MFTANTLSAKNFGAKNFDGKNFSGKKFGDIFPYFGVNFGEIGKYFGEIIFFGDVFFSFIKIFEYSFHIPLLM